jgi:transcriptional regulator with XRE-family HTH domain
MKDNYDFSNGVKNPFAEKMKKGEIIRQRRKELGLSLQEVADRMGTSKQTISKYETGTVTNIPYKSIVGLAKALQSSPAHLMGWEESPSQDIASGFLHIHNGVVTKYNDLNPENKKTIDTLIEALFNQQMHEGGE